MRATPGVAGPADGPLCRPRDRAEALAGRLILAALLITALIAAPATWRSVHGSTLEDIGHESASLRKVEATLSADVTASGYDGAGGRTGQVPGSAVIDDGTGQPETTMVWTDPGGQKGDRVTAWLDSSGEPVHPPRSPDEAAGAAWTATAGVLVLLGMAAAVARSLLRRVMIRTALPGWHREWERVARDWSR
ncbi:hypothetical protein ACFOVU_03555 [Nocardiopsis sediminis]|uniref:DUF3592 domain-containing protein n=1 Tax=Nocardiopsis sediminis TaxID=1778267 RepID=A0ABV8FFX3_9ACTN